MNRLAQGPDRKPTARRRIVAALAEEILSNQEAAEFPIASEHQLCQRFNVSRVTIRLALADLEYHGLIYRRHGKGTFAFGHTRRVHPNLGALIMSADALKSAPVVETISGAQSVMASLRAALVLLTTSPLEWPVEMASGLGGVIVVQREITDDELNVFKKRNLPFLCIQESQLSRGDVDSFTLGRCAAETLNRATLTGGKVESGVIN